MNFYIALCFRDLDNNCVMVRPDPITKELDFHVINPLSDARPIDQLPLTCVDVYRVKELQEDIYDHSHVMRLAARHHESGEEVEIATLAETDGAQFRQLIEFLYKTAVASVDVDHIVVPA